MSLWEALGDYHNAKNTLWSEVWKLITAVYKLFIDYKWVRIGAIAIIGAIILWNYASQPPEINLYDAVMSDIETELGVKPENIVWTDVIYPFDSDSYKKFKADVEKTGKTPQLVEKTFSENLKLLTVRPTDANFWHSNQQNVTIIGMYGDKEIKIMIRYGGDIDIRYQDNYRSSTKSYEMK